MPMETGEKIHLSTALPPKAVPFHVRPVTSWNGRVEISSPEAATPTTTLTPQPLCTPSRAALCKHKDTITGVHKLHQHCPFPQKPLVGEGMTHFTKWQQVLKLNV